MHTILSIPRGPKDVRIASPTAIIMMKEKKKMMRNEKTRDFQSRVLPLAAVMFDMRTSMGLSLSWNFPPLTPVGFATAAILKYFFLYIYGKGERKKKKKGGGGVYLKNFMEPSSKKKNVFLLVLKNSVKCQVTNQLKFYF